MPSICGLAIGCRPAQRAKKAAETMTITRMAQRGPGEAVTRAMRNRSISLTSASPLRSAAIWPLAYFRIGKTHIDVARFIGGDCAAAGNRGRYAFLEPRSFAQDAVDDFANE